MGELLREWNDLDAAESHIVQGVELARQWGNSDGLAWAYLHLAQLQATRGDVAGAQSTLGEAEQVIRRYEVAPWTAAEVAGYRGRLWLRQKNVAEAAHWAQELDLNIENALDFVQLPEQLTFARLLIAQNRQVAATELLERLRTQAQARGRITNVIELLILQALTWRAQGQTEQALVVLEQALSLAEPEGYIRIFVDEGEVLELLISECRVRIAKSPNESTRPLLSFIDRLITAFSSQVLSPRSEVRNQPSEILVEPLSARELEILPLLAAGLANQEIAQQLYVSPATVKVHLKHIYGKLDVNNRTQAVARARELGLL